MKPSFVNFKSIAIVVVFALVLASGFIASKTLLPINTAIKNSGRSIVNASSGVDPIVKVSPGEPSVSSGDALISSGNADVAVWVNTKSGVYHCRNTRWYGNTKNGLYMTQREAQSKGYRPAYGNVCG